jgi:hypothetical protein
MPGRMKAYLVFAGLAVGLHALGGGAGWWLAAKSWQVFDLRSGGGSGFGGGGFRGGK